MTAAEVAKVLRVQTATVHRWARTGELDSIEIGGTRRFRGDYIASLLDGTRPRPDERPAEVAS
jgi:excisionase family DNA binding protein